MSNMKPILIVIAAAMVMSLGIIGVIIIILRSAGQIQHPGFERPERRAGRHGEAIAINVIRQVLREDDYLLSNVRVTIPEKETELDNIVVNKYGVFIIEVKNYKGKIAGAEEDFEWKKYKTTDAGNTFEKTVKNPVRQVKRQIYILARYLDYYGAKVWVKGYAILLEGNSPVDSEYVLKSIGDIDRAIHTPDRTRLDKKTIERIVGLLS